MSRSRGISWCRASSSSAVRCSAPGMIDGSASKSIRSRKSTTSKSSPPSSWALSSSGVIRMTRSFRRNRRRATNFHTMYAPITAPRSTRMPGAKRSIKGRHLLELGAEYPAARPRMRSAHITPPSALNGKKARSGMRTTPASGGATVLKPGTNLAISSERAP